MKCPSNKKGFTIIELLVVMGLIALLLIVVVPAFNDLTGMRLTEESSELARTIRGTYSEAALSGTTFRIVFEMEEDKETETKSSTYWVEASKEEAKGDELVKEDEGAKILDEREREKKKYLRKAEFFPVKGEMGEKRKFAGKVRLHGVWIEGMEERKREGTIYLYFFPTGYTQRAQITLTDDEEGKNITTLMTEPLTGEVVTEYAEKPLK